jgi:hypothetical protein
MILAFLTRFRDYPSVCDGENTILASRSITKAIIPDASHWFNTKELLSLNCAGEGESRVRTHQAELEFQAIFDLASALNYCSTLGLNSDLERITTNLAFDAATVDTTLLNTLYIRFLNILAHLLNTSNVVTFQPLFQNILSIYIVRYVGRQPKYPTNWECGPLTCSCELCAPITTFLISPVERIFRNHYSYSTQDHIRSHLPLWARSDIKWETNTLKYPNEVTITKTARKYKKELKAWNKRRQTTSRRLTDIGFTNLKIYLGDMHDDILGVSVLKLTPFVERLISSATQPSQPKNKLPDHSPTPFTEVKTPAGLMDVDE